MAMQGEKPSLKDEQQKRFAAQNALFERIRKNKSNQQRQEALAKAAAERAKAEEEKEEAKRQEEPQPEDLAEDNAAAIAQACPEPEPELMDANIFLFRPVAGSVEQLDLKPLNLPAGAGQEELAQAYQQMLGEGGVLYYAGQATPGLLKLLFRTATQPGLASLAVEASQELLAYYSHQKPEGPVWVPTLEDFYDALCNLGYRGVAKSEHGDHAHADHGASPEGQPSASGQGAFDEAGCLVSLRVWMRTLSEMCALHSARQDGLVDCLSPQAQEATVKLILGLTELLLCPTVTSCALVQLDECLDALISSWGPGGSSAQQGRGSQEKVELKWKEVAVKVANGVRLIGPNHRARADALRQLPRSSRRKQLQQLMAVQLMADVAAPWKEVTLGEVADLCRVPLEIVRSLAPNPGDLCASVVHRETGKTDFQALLTLFECVSFVLQPLIFEAESVDESQGALANDLYKYIGTLANGLNKSRDGAAVKLCTLLIRMNNSLEFGMDLNAHELSHAGVTAD